MDAKALKEITSQLSLLYVEDDKILRMETAKLFGHLFNKIDIAENGKIGLEMFLAGDYDLIITDINMPEMNGVELCRSIRKENSKITIIITSAHDESFYLLELIDIGIDKFVLKPLDMQKLISTLFTTGTNIINAKLVLKYKQEIEATNVKLRENQLLLKSL
jgi:putative two-component system response regulator